MINLIKFYITLLTSLYSGPILTVLICIIVILTIKAYSRKTSEMDNSDANPYTIAISAGIILSIFNFATGAHDVLDTPAYILSTIASGIMGYYFTHRAWRWPLVIFFTQLVVHSIFKGEISNLWPIAIIFMPFLCLPAVALALVTAWASKNFN